MKYRGLGRTDLHVSVVGVGTWQLGGEWGKTFEQVEVDAMISKAAECGINLIDTAECYGDHLSERLVGRAIKGQRDKWIVATKFGHHFKERFERDHIYEPTLVRKQLEDSLRSLQTDYIDLYQFHSGTDEMFNTPGLWEMLAKQVESGVVRHLGISISKSYRGTVQVDRALDVGAGAIQVVYNRLQRQAEDQFFDGAVRDYLGVLARVPLASGFLSGKYAPDAQFSETDVRTAWHSERQRRTQAEQVMQIRAEVPEGTPMAQWALAWCLQHPAVSCVIPGCKTVDQVESNAGAADLAMVLETHPQAVFEAGK